MFINEQRKRCNNVIGRDYRLPPQKLASLNHCRACFGDWVG